MNLKYSEQYRKNNSAILKLGGMGRRGGGDGVINKFCKENSVNKTNQNSILRIHFMLQLLKFKLNSTISDLTVFFTRFHTHKNLKNININKNMTHSLSIAMLHTSTLFQNQKTVSFACYIKILLYFHDPINGLRINGASGKKKSKSRGSNVR